MDGGWKGGRKKLWKVVISNGEKGRSEEEREKGGGERDRVDGWNVGYGKVKEGGRRR